MFVIDFDFIEGVKSLCAIIEYVVKRTNYVMNRKHVKYNNLVIYHLGQHMLDGGKFMSGVFNEIQQEMSFLARYILNLETTVMDTVPPNIRGKVFKV